MMEAVARSSRPTSSLVKEGLHNPLIAGIRQGDLEVRLARTDAEIEEAQRLRYRVFYGEMGATPAPEVTARGLDFDHFDGFCEHLLVLNHGRGQPGGEVIGTYRLMRRSAAAQAGGFYTAGEFDISKLEAVDGEILELGRACVEPASRSRSTMQLLWRGIGTYVFFNDVKLMFGCASLPGVDPASLATPLSFLHYNHLAPEHIRARALDHRYVRTDILQPQDIDPEMAVAELDSKAATLSALPPLIKGYLRLGGMIGDGAVIDPQFQTVDVCIIVVTDLLARKYFNHYIRNGG